jgi:hypothetical protein
LTDFPDMKLKALVSFPAAVYGGTGLAVRQENGVYYFDLAFDELAQITTIPAPVLPTTFVSLWEATQDTYRLINIPNLQAQIGSGGGGIPDAPSDGTIYGRRNAVWTPVGGGGGVSVTTSDTPPASPSNGALWWKSSNGQLYIYYNDGTSSQWVIAVPTSDPSTFIAKAGDTVTGIIAFTQSPTAPTPPAGDNSSKVATTAFANYKSGAVVDSVYAELTAVTNITVAIPIASTPPTNTQGVEILNATITPKTTTNKLRVRFQGYAAPAAADNMVGAIFLNAETSARAAQYTASPANFFQPILLEYQFVPGSTSPQTVRVRSGSANGNMTFNGSMGGVRRATLVVEEIGA